MKKATAKAAKSSGHNMKIKNEIPKQTAKVSKVDGIIVYPETQPFPTRNKHNELVFKDHPSFNPNLTPEEVLKSGSFGGTYFRTIKSGVTGQVYRDAWKEFPRAACPLRRLCATSPSPPRSDSCCRYDCCLLCNAVCLTALCAALGLSPDPQGPREKQVTSAGGRGFC